MQKIGDKSEGFHSQVITHAPPIFTHVPFHNIFITQIVKKIIPGLWIFDCFHKISSLIRGHSSLNSSCLRIAILNTSYTPHIHASSKDCLSCQGMRMQNQLKTICRFYSMHCTQNNGWVPSDAFFHSQIICNTMQIYLSSMSCASC